MPFTPLQRRTSGTRTDDYPFSTDAEVAFVMAKVEIRCRLPLAFGSVAQAFDPVMGRLDLGELKGNKLPSRRG